MSIVTHAATYCPVKMGQWTPLAQAFGPVLQGLWSRVRLVTSPDEWLTAIRTMEDDVRSFS